MKSIYRKAVHYISRRYDESAWFHLWFILGSAALFNALLFPVLCMTGKGPVAAATTIVLLLTYSGALTFIIAPGDWINEP